MSRKLISSFLIYGIGSGLSQSLLILLVPVYTKYFNTAEYGAFEVISSGFILLTIFGMLQIESAVGRYYYELDTLQKKKAYLSTAFFAVFGISVFISAISISVASPLSMMLFETESYAPILITAFLAIPLANPFYLFAVLVRFEQKPILYGVVTFLQISLNISIALYSVIILNTGIIGVFYGQIIGFSVGFFLYLIYFRKYLQLTFDKGILKNYFQFSLPMLPAVLGSWTNNHANRFFMLSYLTLSDIGLYSVALKIASVFKLLEMAFQMAWQPFFIEQYTQEGHKEVYRKVFRTVGVGLIILVGCMFLLAQPIIEWTTTPEYYQSAGLVGLLSVALAIPILVSTVNLGPILKKKQFSIPTVISFQWRSTSAVCFG